MTISDEPERGYPFLQLRVEIDEAFVERIVAPLGGVRFDGARIFPAGVKPVDFRVGNYLLEYKGIERDPMAVQDRHGKAVNFAMGKVQSGAATVVAGDKTRPGIIRLTGETSQEYWRKFLGVSVGRQMEKAAEQIRSSREFLGDANLHGAVFIVNQSAPFIDPHSFEGLVATHRARFADAIDIAVLFSRIPGVVTVDGEEKLGTPQGYFPRGTQHDEFGNRFLEQFEVQLLTALGRDKLEQMPDGSVLKPARLPLRVSLPDGTKVRFH